MDRAERPGLVAGGSCCGCAARLGGVDPVADPAAGAQLGQWGNNDAVGFLGATAAVVYAIIVGFKVITLWENYVAAGDTVENETSSLRDLVQFSGAFGPAAQNEIHHLVVQYAKSVSTKEWQAMAQGGG